MAARALFLLSACAACLVLASAAPARNNADCVTPSLLSLSGLNVYPASHQIYSSQIAYANDKTTVQIADNFQVTYYKTFKVVTAKYNATLSESYLLYQCGSVPPSLDSLGLPAGTKTFSVPLTAVSAPDTSVLGFMKMLGLEDRVSYVTEYAVDPCMQYLAGTQCNRSSDSAPSDQVDGYFEFYLAASDPQAVLFRATADPGPLNRAEYIKLVATFFNREAEANTQFQAVAAAYGNIARQAQAYLTTTQASPPLVAWLYYSAAYKDSKWDLPEFVSLKFAQYRKDFTADAGGRLHDLPQLSASSLVDGVNVVAAKDELLFYNLDSDATRAALAAVLQDVQVAIDESYYATPATYTYDLFLTRYRLSQLPSAPKFLGAGGQVLRLDAEATPLGSTGSYEQAVARPDLFLRDLSQAILPTAQLTFSDTASPRQVRSLAPPASSSSSPSLLGSSVALVDATACPAAQQRCAARAPQAICPAVFLDCSGKLVTATAAQPCAPTCVSTGNGNTGGSGGGAAGRAVLAPALMLVLLGLALLAVARPGW